MQMPCTCCALVQDFYGGRGVALLRIARSFAARGRNLAAQRLRRFAAEATCAEPPWICDVDNDTFQLLMERHDCLDHRTVGCDNFQKECLRAVMPNGADYNTWLFYYLLQKFSGCNSSERKRIVLDLYNRFCDKLF